MENMKEDDMSGKGNNTTELILAFLLGGLVGAGAALLMAPQSGKETREKIREMAKEWEEKAEAWYRDKFKSQG